MLYKIICLSLMLSLMSLTHPLLITNNGSLPLIVMVQEGQFVSNKPSYLLHIECGKDAKLTITENINMTIVIMQVSTSPETNKPTVNSLYSKTACFNNQTNIICNDIGAIESVYRKIYSIIY